MNWCPMTWQIIIRRRLPVKTIKSVRQFMDISKTKTSKSLSYMGGGIFKTIYIHIYAFSRSFYPKQLTVHSGYTFCQYVCFLGIEPTNFCAANTMLYHWATETCGYIYIYICDLFILRFLKQKGFVYHLPLHIMPHCNHEWFSSLIPSHALQAVSHQHIFFED